MVTQTKTCERCGAKFLPRAYGSIEPEEQRLCPKCLAQSVNQPKD